MVESTHRIRLLGSWSLARVETEWVLARRFHLPTGLTSLDQVFVKWIVAPGMKVVGARLNERVIQVESLSEGSHESQNIRQVLQPSNEVQIILEETGSETHREESHVVPSADSEWLKTVWLEIVPC